MNFYKSASFFLLFFAITLIFSSCHQPIIRSQSWQLVASGFSFPEGPAWDSNGILYVSNCTGNWIAKIIGDQIDTLLVASDSTFGKTNGLLVADDGSIVGCDFGNGTILKISPTGKVKQVISQYQGQLFNRPNDIIQMNNGDIYFTDPKSYGADKTDGRLFYYSFSMQELCLAADSLAFPNGLGVSPNDGKMYLSESAKNQIIRFEIGENGILQSRETFIQLPGGDPDGIEFDVKGNLFVAHFGTGTVYVISPDGKILQQISAPGKKPSNLEFGDDDLRTLYLTEDGTNSVYKMRVKYPGCRLKHSD